MVSMRRLPVPWGEALTSESPEPTDPCGLVGGKLFGPEFPAHGRKAAEYGRVLKERQRLLGERGAAWSRAAGAASPTH
jgi:hypothetical protein